MKTLKFNFKKNDSGKVQAELSHVFYPFEDDKDVRITCRYIPSGKFLDYARINGGTYDMEKCFLSQVDKIEGVKIEDQNGKEIDVTPELFVTLAGEFVTAVVTRVFAHLVSNEGLSEDEVKN